MLDLGMGDLGATLCARLPGVFDEFVMTNADAWGGRFIDYWKLPNTADEPYDQIASTDPRVGNMPYGRPVEPDVPV